MMPMSKTGMSPRFLPFKTLNERRVRGIAFKGKRVIGE